MKITRKIVTSSLFALALGAAASGAMAADQFAEGFEAANTADYKRAAQHFKPLADKGHADAQLFIAMMYHSGAAGVVNEKEAVRLYHEAAENGNSTAQEYLAAAYREGWFGLKKDKKKARYWESRLQK